MPISLKATTRHWDSTVAIIWLGRRIRVFGSSSPVRSESLICRQMLQKRILLMPPSSFRTLALPMRTSVVTHGNGSAMAVTSMMCAGIATVAHTLYGTPTASASNRRWLTCPMVNTRLPLRDTIAMVTETRLSSVVLLVKNVSLPNISSMKTRQM